ncbi:MAG: ATP-dependent helicase [Bifidobacteriaceae bacterium]|jgi:DNA helicase-2/ATP-dependent DNA helicase PcrA|nr:ATP-dependent helicase [Bifidobacteriaceae bacterium]
MDENLDNILAALDSNQKKAVMTLDGPLYILAGAGAGKTRTITHRIAYAVKSKHWEASSIIATTFTTKAAIEMKERLEQLGILGVSVNTFHAHALHQLKNFWKMVSKDQFPSILDNRFSFIQSICKAAGFSFSAAQIGSISDQIGLMKTSLIPIENYANASTWSANCNLDFISANDFISLSNTYESKKAQNNKIDFEDIMLVLIHIIEKYPNIAKTLRSTYRHFIVDEFQDVSPLQYYMLRMWMGDSRDLCVVGDPSQTIYSFAGASCYYLNNFDKEFPGANHIKISKNYRSNAAIVDLANSVLAKKRNKDYEQLKLESNKNSRNAIEYNVYKNEKEEAEKTVDKIISLINSDAKLSDIAVLYRARFQARNIIDELNNRNIPYIEKDGQKFFDYPIIELLLQTIKANRGFYDVTLKNEIEYMKVFSERLNSDMVLVLKQKGEKEKLKNIILLKGFFKVVNEFFEHIQKTGFLSFSTDDFFKYIQNMKSLEVEPELDCITLASIHSSKGLEYEIVFLVAASDGNMPIALATAKDEIEEERRLLYVAITRAKERLFISYSALSNGRRAKVSRFFEKIWKQEGKRN